MSEKGFAAGKVAAASSFGSFMATSVATAAFWLLENDVEEHLKCVAAAGRLQNPLRRPRLDTVLVLVTAATALVT